MKCDNCVDMSAWLVASDIDGTLNSKLRRLPKANFDAISRFVTECSGNFTLASGRSVSSLKTHYDALPAMKGTPVVVLNGAGLYDYENSRMLHFSALSEKTTDMVCDAAKRFKRIGVAVYTKDIIYGCGPAIFSKYLIFADKSGGKYYKGIEDIPRGEWGKVVFTGLPTEINKLKKYLFSLEDSDATFMSSSIASFEVLAKNTNKGAAVLKLADILGIEHSHTCAIGDYFNDEAMLKSVGISAACGQAPKKLRESVDYVACHCNNGAVADFLGYIEKTVSNK